MVDSLSSLLGSSQGSLIDRLVSQYMALERRPVDALKSTKDRLTVSSGLFTDLKAKISELKDLADDLASDTDSVFEAHTATTSDSTLATATASGSASNGSYRLAGVTLAKAHRVQSDQKSSSWTTSGGTFVVNGAAIEVTSGASLADVRDAINEAAYSTGREVLATVVDNTLVLEGKSTGSAYGVKVADLTGTVLSSLGLATTASSAVAVGSASASSSLDGSHPDGNAVDGTADDAHAWIGAEGESSWTLTLDLGSSQSVSRLVWGRDRGGVYSDRTPKDYTVEYWDGSAWNVLKTVAGKSLALGAAATETFYPVTTSQLRMTITATNDGTAPALDEVALYDDAGSFSHAALQSPTNASFEVNGIPVTRSANTGLSDVVSGLTLDLKGEGGPATIEVASDTAGMRSKIEAFLQKLNALTDYLKTKSAVAQDATGNYARGPLYGYSLYTGLQLGLATDLAREVEGVPTGAPGWLSELGIEMDSDLHFVVEDSTALNDWLSSNPGGVAALFGGESGIATRVFDRLKPYVVAPSLTTKAYLDQEQSSIADQREAVDDRIAGMNERLALREQQLRTQFMKLQSLMTEAVNQQQRLQSMFGYSSGWGVQ